ncbi:hypothetical protein [Rhizobium leguminosarum]|uniref:hypothetical protein n=1 Tax=Rhizobium leguminosarum TaxID=384 RepID=UPI001441B0D3|nr:hypothetical protein [Rhizobium leguminosarum]NKL57131.1 hypothetical protein [Rhizobium leguminosarum bv. viciae]
MDKARKIAAAIALLIIAFFIVVLVLGIIANRRAEIAQKDKVLAQLNAIEASADSQALKSKRVIDLAFDGWDNLEVIEANSPGASLGDRALQHISMGYQATDPVGSQVFERLANRDCAGRINGVTTMSGYTEQDVINGWQLAKDDLRTWLPYISNPQQVSNSCEDQFESVLKRTSESKGISMKDLGEAAGKGANDVRDWWNEATKPISDAVKNFKDGYNSQR